jgi:hypothetical protein
VVQIEDVLLHRLAEAVLGAAACVSGSSSQASASCALLAVALGRSLGQLAGAMEAAGPQLLFDSLAAQPCYRVMWSACGDSIPGSGQDSGGTALSSDQQPTTTSYQWGQLGPLGSLQQSTVVGQWCCWQARMVRTAATLHSALQLLGLAGASEAAASAAIDSSTSSCNTSSLMNNGRGAMASCGAGSSETAASSTKGCSEVAASSAASSNGTAAGDEGRGGGTTSRSASSDDVSSRNTSSDNSSGSKLKWGHLLKLQQSSAHWAAAVTAHSTSCKNSITGPQLQGDDESAAGMARQVEQTRREYAASIALCKELAAAAPLAVVCNNLGCSNLAGVSDAVTGARACSGCRCRYCSVECQKADWQRHKHACRSMAAARAGLEVR